MTKAEIKKAVDRERARQWRLRNPDKVKAANDRRDKDKLRHASKEYYRKNVDNIRPKARERMRSAYMADPSRNITSVVKYRANNLCKVNERIRKWSKERRQNDIQWRLSCNLRRRLSMAVAVGRSRKESGAALRNLGCTTAELVVHLENMFNEHMNWDNYGTVWNIDHRKPLSAFDLSDQTQVAEACHYSNLQPLFVADNIRKGGARKNRLRT